MRAATRCILAYVVVLAAFGCDKKPDASEAATTAAAAGARAVPIAVDNKGFTPSSVDVKKGEKVQLIFTRTSAETCATEVVFPEINLKKELPLNKAVAVDVPTDAARTLAFQCGMGMYKSKLVIN